MAISKTEQIYQQHIKPLMPSERLALIEIIARDLAMQKDYIAENPKHNIMELNGLGKEIWNEIDAQEYVNELRKEWDQRQ
jgi:hypothetical protein